MTTARCFYENELPGDLSILDQLYPILQDWCAAGGLGFADGHRVIVAVTEAVTNAVIHAKPDAASPTVFVSLWLDTNTMRADVGDHGQWGWSPPKPPTPEQWEQTGGRGLELIRQLTHSYDIRPRDGGGTLVSMSFKTQGIHDTKNHVRGRGERAGEGGRTMDSRVESFNDVDVMRVTGRIDLVTSNTLKDNIRERLQRQRTNIVLNMERVDFINSSGLGAMVSILKDVRLADGRLVLSNLAPYVQEIFEITQLANVFEIFSAEDAAVSALSGTGATAETR
ncbi:MAG: anti-sigma factor antagonist [candidate division Zixibacteria bacterium]|nr:anti-sigma factor antagonist [candidate division Zixibacteria bacterium]